MKQALWLYCKLVHVSLKSQMQHRASFIMLTLAHCIATFVDIIGIWILFDRFRLIQGWTFEELSILYGVVQMGFALAEGFGRGFDTFWQILTLTPCFCNALTMKYLQKIKCRVPLHF